jgi:uncharacterized protein YcbK (DUF882 family)
MDQGFLIRLDYARGLAGVPFNINSGYRCTVHNKSVGGSSTSSHLNGTAVDIKAVTDYTRFRILASLLSVGFKRIGIRKDFIHADVDPNKNPERFWLYE